MIKLILDIGNTSVKSALWKNKQLLKKNEYPTWASVKSTGLPENKEDPEAIIISSVINRKLFSGKLFGKKKEIIFLDQHTPVPVKVKYKTPESLGNDRLANAVGALTLFPGKHVLVIDAGTCLKFDFIDKQGNYLGGSIAPGLMMRFMALKKFTAKLPLLAKEKKFLLTGRSTKESIVAGVQMGILAEANGIIESYMLKYNDLKIVLTGGDFRFFAGNLKKHIFVSPNLTLLGLNEILDFNIN